MTYFVVSDVHDHYGLMRDALARKGFDENNDTHRLIICGDAFYNGPQPGELFEFLQFLHEKERLVFIYGNHDIELLDNLKDGKFRRPDNRTCAKQLVTYCTGKTDLSDIDIISECKALGFTDFLATIPVWFHEIDRYVFTHGFIPTERNAYKPDWRSSSEKEWRSAVLKGDAMLLSLRYGVSEPEKIIVSGHYSAARCYLMQNASEEDWKNKLYKDVSHVPPEGFQTFYGNTFIALDASTKKSGFVNCIRLEIL